MTEPVATIETVNATITRWPNGLVEVFNHPADHTLADAERVHAILVEIRRDHGSKLRVLVDTRPVRSLSRDARLLYQSDDHAAIMLGAALLVDSGVSRVIGNFFIGLNRGKVRSRLFSDESEARSWLEGLSDG